MHDIVSHQHHTTHGDDAGTSHTAPDIHSDHGLHFAHAHVDAQSDVLGTHNDVPWLNFGPHDAQPEHAHGDAVANAAHAASGATNLPVGAVSSGVPWQQITPDAMHNDTDGDGIPDAIDNHVGPGA